MKVIPLHDQILIKRLTVDPQKSNLILPQAMQTVSNRGVVLAVGAGKLLDNGNVRPVCVQEGDTVVFHEPYRPHKETIDGEEAIIIVESDLIAKLVKD
ncbi:MAG: co-chaperone GroES [Aestuariibacter sp.]|nr:co-chaperone GroES [Aestuariibacter sp.]